MRNMWQVLWEPKRVFERLREGTPVAPVALITIAVDCAVALALIPYFRTAVTTTLEASGNATLAQGSLTTLTVVIAVITATLSSVGLIAGVSVVLSLASLVLGGMAKYRDIFGVLVLGSVPTLIGRVGRAIAFLAGFTQDPKYSLTSLGGVITGDGSILAFLRAVDVLDLWAFVLIVMGFGIVAGLPKVRAYAAAGLLWGGLQVLLIRATVAGGG